MKTIDRITLEALRGAVIGVPIGLALLVLAIRWFDGGGFWYFR